jgi:DNA-binding winged helix-turn-helix (wHTH) protein
LRYRFGRFTLDETRAELLRDEEPVLLTNKAFAVLTVLVKSHGRVVTTRELMQTVWAGSFVERGSVAQNVFILRKLLAIDGDNPIETQPRSMHLKIIRS